jgi:hypothetical protein
VKFSLLKHFNKVNGKFKFAYHNYFNPKLASPHKVIILIKYAPNRTAFQMQGYRHLERYVILSLHVTLGSAGIDTDDKFRTASTGQFRIS